jgi:protein-S-isoprenylcysteine O-methyltransferase Ste14
MNIQSVKTDSNTKKTQRAKRITDYKTGIIRWIGQMTAALLLSCFILFLSAGTLNWLNGWIYIGMNAFTQALSAIVLIPRQPDMLDERSKVREGTKGYDRFLAPAIVLFGTLAVLITAGLDDRFGWSMNASIGLTGLGLILSFGSQMFVLWVMATNPFFSTTVRIQEDRGHQIISGGPYQLVRHPGYAGSLVFNLAIPLVLGSLWTYLPALIVTALLFIRTALEDRTLQNELTGYREYASSVRYRLIPGLW